MTSTNDISKIIINTLSDLKAQDIISLDVSSLSNVTDQIILATPRSSRNAIAIANKLIENTKSIAEIKPQLSKDSSSNWMIIDYKDIIVHLMLKEIRDFYKLEKLWDIKDIADIKNPII